MKPTQLVRLSLGAMLFFVSLLCPVKARAAVIGVDNLHFTTEFDNLTGFYFRSFRSAITSQGHTFVPLTAFDTPNLAGFDAIIIRQATYSTNNYSASEISAIHNFVATGHGLIVSGEVGAETTGTVDNINSLVAPYGVTFGTSELHGAGFTITGFVSHPLTSGITTLGVDYERPMISIQSPAIDLTLGSGSSDMLAVVPGTGGHGNVVLLADTSMWANIEDRPITFGDNRQLLLNAVNYVTAVPEPSSMLFGLGMFSFAARVLWQRRRNAIVTN